MRIQQRLFCLVALMKVYGAKLKGWVHMELLKVLL